MDRARAAATVIPMAVARWAPACDIQFLSFHLNVERQGPGALLSGRARDVRKPSILCSRVTPGRAIGAMLALP